MIRIRSSTARLNRQNDHDNMFKDESDMEDIDADVCSTTPNS